MAYDPDNWLLSTTRELGSYVAAAFVADPDVTVEMSFPDTRSWTKTTPLDKVLIHFEQDDVSDPTIAFDTIGVDVPNLIAGTIERQEAVMHTFDYDVGVWVSAEMGGATKRMEVVQALKNLFVPVTAKMAFNATTGGLQIVSFEGARNELDRINDIPVWRTLNMTLIVKCFSRHIPATPDWITINANQSENLTIQNPSGTTSPAITP